MLYRTYMLLLELVAGFCSQFGQHTFWMLQLPLVWRQLYEFLMCGVLMIGHLGNDVIQVISRIHVVCLIGSQEGTDYRHIDGCLMIAAAEVILAPQCDGPDNTTVSLLLFQKNRLYMALFTLSPESPEPLLMVLLNALDHHYQVTPFHGIAV